MVYNKHSALVVVMRLGAFHLVTQVDTNIVLSFLAFNN